MGQSSTGILAYGYDLGGPEHWKFSNSASSPIRNFTTGSDWVRGACNSMLIKCGYEEAKPYAEEDKVAEHFGVEFVRYTSIDYPRYILAVSALVYKVYDYGATALPNNAIAHDAKADAMLDRAINALNINPHQQNPKWFLASEYS